jgi:hypothetical protein
MHKRRGCVCVMVSALAVTMMSVVMSPAAFGSGPLGNSRLAQAPPTGPEGTPVPDESQPATLQTVADPAGNVTPGPETCWTSGSSPLQSYPINTQENLCMVNDQGYVCDFSAEYGNVFSVAFAKLMLDSGYCDTSSTHSSDQVTAYYSHSGTDSSSTTYGPYSFGSWTQASGPSSSSIYEGRWVVCMQITVGVAGDGDECLTLTSSPL